MTRLRQDRQSARDERDGAARVQRPDVDSAQRVLALQRTAGNRAVSAMLQRMPDAASKPWQSPKGWDALWGDGPARRTRHATAGGSDRGSGRGATRRDA